MKRRCVYLCENLAWYHNVTQRCLRQPSHFYVVLSYHVRIDILLFGLLLPNFPAIQHKIVCMIIFW